MKIGSLKKGEGGFTLLELLVAIAISAIITTSVTGAIFQTFTGSARSSNHMVAVRQVQEAGYWISFYGYAAQNTTMTGVSGFPLIMTWIDFETSEKHRVVFNVTGSGLRGLYYVWSNNNWTLNLTRTARIPVFGSINRTGTSCRVVGGSAFGLPDAGDAFTITGGNTSDYGRITVTGGSISVNWTSGATCQNVSGGWSWNITTPGATVRVSATGVNTRGSWTSENKAVTAAITTDSDGDAVLSSARGLILTVTAVVGPGRQQGNETRTYLVVPKPAS